MLVFLLFALGRFYPPSQHSPPRRDFLTPGEQQGLFPFVLIFMLILINNLVNNKELMGDYINPQTFNINSWVAVVTMIVLTRWMVVTSFFLS